MIQLNAKLLRIIGGINFVLFIALFSQISFSYMFKMLLVLNPDLIESPGGETNIETYAFLMPLFIMIIAELLLIAMSSIFSFYLSLNYTLFFESIGLFSLIVTMTLPLLYLPFELISLFINEFLANFIIPILIFSILIFLFILKLKPNYKKQAVVRKLVLSFSTKHSNFKLSKLAILCSADKDFVKAVVKSMIGNSEIYAEYFKNTKKFAFNIRVNNEEINRLMEMFSEWEAEHIEKKV